MAPHDVVTKRAYHLRELEIARDPGDPGHVSPPAANTGEFVLDIGCGAGQTLMTTYSGGRSVGIDVDMEALQFGKELGCPAPLACARAEQLPFRTRSIHMVIARSSLQYTDLTLSLPEIRRVLTSGGTAWMLIDSFWAVWNVSRGWHAKAWLHFLYVTGNSLVFRLTGSNIPFTGSRHETFQTQKGIRSALLAAGFTEISVQPLKRSWKPTEESIAARKRGARDSLMWMVTARAP